MSEPVPATLAAQPGESMHIERLGRWPGPGDPGRYVSRCSCRRWAAMGTVEEINRAGIWHDDSPSRNHVVVIYGRVVPP